MFSGSWFATIGGADIFRKVEAKKRQGNVKLSACRSMNETPPDLSGENYSLTVRSPAQNHDPFNGYVVVAYEFVDDGCGHT